jgi:hypothetical protein
MLANVPELTVSEKTTSLRIYNSNLRVPKTVWFYESVGGKKIRGGVFVVLLIDLNEVDHVI